MNFLHQYLQQGVSDVLQQGISDVLQQGVCDVLQQGVSDVLLRIHHKHGFRSTVEIVLHFIKKHNDNLKLLPLILPSLIRRKYAIMQGNI